MAKKPKRKRLVKGVDWHVWVYVWVDATGKVQRGPHTYTTKPSSRPWYDGCRPRGKYVKVKLVEVK